MIGRATWLPDCLPARILPVHSLLVTQVFPKLTKAMYVVYVHYDHFWGSGFGGKPEGSVMSVLGTFMIDLGFFFSLGDASFFLWKGVGNIGLVFSGELLLVSRFSLQFAYSKCFVKFSFKICH